MVKKRLSKKNKIQKKSLGGGKKNIVSRKLSPRKKMSRKLSPRKRFKEGKRKTQKKRYAKMKGGKKRSRKQRGGMNDGAAPEAAPSQTKRKRDDSFSSNGSSNETNSDGSYNPEHNTFGALDLEYNSQADEQLGEQSGEPATPFAPEGKGPATQLAHAGLEPVITLEHNNRERGYNANNNNVTPSRPNKPKKKKRRGRHNERNKPRIMLTRKQRGDILAAAARNGDITPMQRAKLYRFLSGDSEISLEELDEFPKPLFDLFVVIMQERRHELVSGIVSNVDVPHLEVLSQYQQYPTKMKHNDIIYQLELRKTHEILQEEQIEKIKRMYIFLGAAAGTIKEREVKTFCAQFIGQKQHDLGSNYFFDFERGDHKCIEILEHGKRCSRGLKSMLLYTDNRNLKLKFCIALICDGIHDSSETDVEFIFAAVKKCYFCIFGEKLADLTHEDFFRCRPIFVEIKNGRVIIPKKGIIEDKYLLKQISENFDCMEIVEPFKLVKSSLTNESFMFDAGPEVYFMNVVTHLGASYVETCAQLSDRASNFKYFGMAATAGKKVFAKLTGVLFRPQTLEDSDGAFNQSLTPDDRRISDFKSFFYHYPLELELGHIKTNFNLGNDDGKQFSITHESEGNKTQVELKQSLTADMLKEEIRAYKANPDDDMASWLKILFGKLDGDLHQIWEAIINGIFFSSFDRSAVAEGILICNTLYQIATNITPEQNIESRIDQDFLNWVRNEMVFKAYLIKQCQEKYPYGFLMIYDPKKRKGAMFSGPPEEELKKILHYS